IRDFHVTGVQTCALPISRHREMIGPDIELMLDCWMAFDVEFAVRMAERLRPYRLRWIEDCLTPENMDAHTALRQRLPWQTLASEIGRASRRERKQQRDCG